MKETILDVFLRKYRINIVKHEIEKYNNCKLLDIGCGWEARLLKSMEQYIDYGVGIDFKPPELKTDKLETIKLTLEKILPFENSLYVLTMKGSEVKNLLTVMASLNGEGLSGARIKMTEQGEMLQCSVQEAPIDNQKDYTIATIDYLADGNDGFTPFLRAEKRECPPNATLRSLFLNYIEQQTAEGKKVTSRIDGRITIVPGSN